MRKFAPVFVILFALFTSPALAEEQQYTCPMHPHYISVEPGDCPICGMALVPLNAPSEGGDALSGDGKGESGRALVALSPETIQRMGVRTERAATALFGAVVRSFGNITENIRLQQDVSSRVDGWVESLAVEARGDAVTQGDKIFSFYSPALVAAQKDLISALATGSTGRVDAASARLLSLGMQKKAVSRVKKTRRAFQNVPVYAEKDGVVSDIHIREGSYIKPGMKLIQLQNYASVWVDVSVAEQDIPYISAQTQARVSLPALGIDNLRAKVDYIYPTIDRTTRTGRVRLVLDNADGRLKPGAYANVDFETSVQKRLSVPSEAILKSGEGDYVVLRLDEGRFQPKKVQSGLRYKGRTEILSGLNEEEEVVVSGQFLIDSESALRESFRKMQKMQTPLSLLEVTDNQMAMINHLIDAALYIHEELAIGEVPNPNMLLSGIKLGDHLMPVFRGTKLQHILEDAEKALIQTKDSLTLEEWRTGLNRFILALKPWLFEGRPDYYKDKGLALFMAHGEDLYWLQFDEEAANPYGKGHPMKLDWPPQPTAETPVISAQPPGGGHAHH